MSQRDELYKLLETGRKYLKDPIKETADVSELIYYGCLKTDVYMGEQALTRNSVPMIQFYIDKLTLHLGGPDASQEESQDNG